ncbi:28584_t:CDS:2, partial [Racocetra persica]
MGLEETLRLLDLVFENCKIRNVRFDYYWLDEVTNLIEKYELNLETVYIDNDSENIEIGIGNAVFSNISELVVQVLQNLNDELLKVEEYTNGLIYNAAHRYVQDIDNIFSSFSFNRYSTRSSSSRESSTSLSSRESSPVILKKTYTSDQNLCQLVQQKGSINLVSTLLSLTDIVSTLSSLNSDQKDKNLPLNTNISNDNLSIKPSLFWYNQKKNTGALKIENNALQSEVINLKEANTIYNKRKKISESQENELKDKIKALSDTIKEYKVTIKDLKNLEIELRNNKIEHKEKLRELITKIYLLKNKNEEVKNKRKQLENKIEDLEAKKYNKIVSKAKGGY